MISKTGKLLIVITTGFIVLVVYSVVLFFGRLNCYEKLIGDMPEDWRRVTICPSGLVPGEGEPKQTKDILTYAEAGISNDPNMKLSAFKYEMDNHYIQSESLGVIRGYIWNKGGWAFSSKDRIYYYYSSENDYLMLDRRSGQIVTSYISTTRGPDGKDISKVKVYFAGPNGVSDKPSPSLGRFETPIVDNTSFYRRLGVYDAGQRRFYLINYKKEKIDASPQLPPDANIKPAAIGEGEYLAGSWLPPMAKDVNDEWRPKHTFLPAYTEPNERWIYFNGATDYLSVLDKSGQIYEVNTVDWSMRIIGHLPLPRSEFSYRPEDRVARPGDLSGYQIAPVYYVLIGINKDKTWNEKDNVRYFGLCVVSLSREGTAVAVAVFDPNGKLICRGDSKSTGGINTASAVYTRSSAATTFLFLLENLQPVVFEAASYLCGDCIDASVGHRTLFILPDSFAGMLGRYNGPKYDRPVFLPLLMGPSLILAVWLMLCVRKDAKTAGLSGKAIQWWTIVTFLFGLPAYITYRLTRPRETLVTCKNCGHLRRPDMETCHRCGSKWEVPELMEPGWRIKD